MIDWKITRQKLLGEESQFSLPPNIQLPVLPVAVIEFIRKADDPDAKVKELSKVIESDAGLTAELLRYVNSSAFGMRKKVSTAEQTLTLLGIKKTKLFLMTSGVQESMKSRASKLINLKNFWIANLERAIFAREVAIMMKVDADIAFAGGMLLDLLLPILTNELATNYQPYFDKLAGQEHEELHNFERKQFRWDHACAGAHVLHGWGFPDELICAVFKHTEGFHILQDPVLGHSVVAAISISALIPDACQQMPRGLNQLFEMQDKHPAFNLVEIANRVDHDFQQMSNMGEGYMSLKKRVDKKMQELKIEAMSG
jgi:serine/threonine-protein kinase